VLYAHFGWRVFCASLILMVCGSIFCLRQLQHAARRLQAG
jgi:hypothetical protein